MKLWQILKNENNGRLYKDNKHRLYRLALNMNEHPILVEENSRIACQFAQEDIMKLDFEEYAKPKVTGWEKAFSGGIYWGIKDSGIIGSYNDMDDFFDTRSYETCNYFSTEEKATEVMNDQLLYRKMLKYRDTHDDTPIIWEYPEEESEDTKNVNEVSTGGWRIIYDHCKGGFIQKRSRYLETIGVVYFSSAEVARDCIREIVVPHYAEVHAVNK